jgi:LacI family transcriptional regulator
VKTFTKLGADGFGRVTLTDVARAAKVAVATASYALRGSAKIPAETAARVRAVADSLGYRPNPRFAELMAAVRRGGAAASGERLALVWVEKTDSSRGFAREVAAGARQRAAERGYKLEEFQLTAYDAKRPERLAEVIAARGITGVVFGPMLERDRVEVAWPWARFAMAVIGAADWGVALSRAAHHHYEAMRLALDGLARAGAKRPVALLDGRTNERAHRGWQAAWLAYGPHGAEGRLRLLDEGETPITWLKARKADGVVASNARILGDLRKELPQLAVTLAREPGDGLPGVVQGYDVIAGHAVDLVVAQLQRNERGLPETPRVLLFAGRWAET